MQAIFRKYDLRGIVGKDFEIQDAYQIASSILTYLKQKYPLLKKIAIGMDGRKSSLAIKTEVCKAIMDQGLDVYFVGLCPTPVLYYACYTMEVDAGIMITASHNPKEYNGFKIVLQKESIWGDDIKNIAQICHNHKFTRPEIKSAQANYFEENQIDSYIEYLVTQFRHLKGNPLKLVIDCGNGAAGSVIPKLVQRLEWSNITILYPEIDGNYPHHNPDPVELKNMLDVQAFLENNPHTICGTGLDGDCDRMATMTRSGHLIPSDQLLGIFALNIEKKYRPSVVMDVKCSDAVASLLRTENIPCYISPTGHAYIKSYLKKHHAMLGGELSGHFCFKDRYLGFDDGIYAWLRLCELLIQSKQTLEQFLAKFPITFCSPEFRIPCPDDQKELVVKDVENNCKEWLNTEIIAIDGIRIQNIDGWAVVRAANTEPAISIRIEGYTATGLEKFKNDLFVILSKHINRSILAHSMNLKTQDEN